MKDPYRNGRLSGSLFFFVRPNQLLFEAKGLCVRLFSINNVELRRCLIRGYIVHFGELRTTWNNLLNAIKLIWALGECFSCKSIKEFRDY